MRAGWLFTFIVLVCVLALVPVPAPAQTGDVVTTEAAPVEAARTADSWLGGLAAIGCGVMVRATIITAGTQVGTIAGAVACCAYAVIDLVFIDPQ
jgi:hypothetical protein